MTAAPIPTIVCQFNGAKDAGEPRFDPRFDCTAEAVWHLLLSQEARETLTTRAAAGVMTCEEHAMNVYYSIVMRHRAERACIRPGARWRLTTNQCVDNPGQREDQALSDLSKPCPVCRDGRHDECGDAVCGCIADHPDDTQMMRGFKQVKRQLHPERESEVRGGWR